MVLLLDLKIYNVAILHSFLDELGFHFPNLCSIIQRCVQLCEHQRLIILLMGYDPQNNFQEKSAISLASWLQQRLTLMGLYSAYSKLISD